MLRICVYACELMLMGLVVAATSLAGNADDQTTSTAAITTVSPERT